MKIKNKKKFWLTIGSIASLGAIAATFVILSQVKVNSTYWNSALEVGKDFDELTFKFDENMVKNNQFKVYFNVDTDDTNNTEDPTDLKVFSLYYYPHNVIYKDNAFDFSRATVIIVNFTTTATESPSTTSINSILFQYTQGDNKKQYQIYDNNVGWNSYDFSFNFSENLSIDNTYGELDNPYVFNGNLFWYESVEDVTNEDITKQEKVLKPYDDTSIYNICRIFY